MIEDINDISVKPEVGNSTKPLLCEVFLSEGWISAKDNPPKNNKNVVVKSFLNDDDFEEEIAYYENGTWHFYINSDYKKEVLYYFVYPSSC